MKMNGRFEDTHAKVFFFFFFLAMFLSSE